MTSTHRFRTGYTLIELIAVVTLLSLVSATITVSFRRPLLEARFSSFCETLLGIDDRARSAAMASEVSGQIVFDLKNQAVKSSRSNDGSLFWQTIYVPDGLRLVALRTRHGRVSDDSVVLPVSISGATATYALNVTSTAKSRWIIVFGGTGQSWEVEDEKEVEKLFKSIRQQGIDAD